MVASLIPKLSKARLQFGFVEVGNGKIGNLVSSNLSRPSSMRNTSLRACSVKKSLFRRKRKSDVLDSARFPSCFHATKREAPLGQRSRLPKIPLDQTKSFPKTSMKTCPYTMPRAPPRSTHRLCPQPASQEQPSRSGECGRSNPLFDQANPGVLSSILCDLSGKKLLTAEYTEEIREAAEVRDSFHVRDLGWSVAFQL